MLIPLILLILATLASAVMAYGTHPSWAQYPHGLDLILWTRILQWPLIAFALVLCVALLAMIVAGKRRAWWLIGLAPVLALFAHKYHLRPGRELAVVENPMMVAADQVHDLADDTYVVGVVFGEQAYAFPYPALFESPAVLVPQREKKLMVIWSADANRAVAQQVDMNLRGRDLEVVSTPANSLLLYNSRLGQFIVGVTGHTPKGDVPTGFRQPLFIDKMPWSAWRSAHPQTQVMAAGDAKRIAPPTRPIWPRFPMPPAKIGLDARMHIALIETVPPAAIAVDVVGDRPANITLGSDPVLLLRDPSLGTIRAYDRRIDNDLYVRLKPYSNAKKPQAVYVDDSTNSLWSRGIVALEGGPEIKGKKLIRLPVEQDLYWGVMKCWYPDLQLYQPTADPGPSPLR